MAVLQRIRNHSVALLVSVGFAMAAFIVGDLLTSSSSIMQSNRDKVVTINGKKVTYEIYKGALTHLIDGGSLYIVIRKQQGALSVKSYLEELFGNVAVLAREKGYYILQAIKHEAK